MMALNKQFRMRIFKRTIETLKNPPRKPAQTALLRKKGKIFFLNEMYFHCFISNLAAERRAMMMIARVNLDLDFSIAMPCITCPVNQGVKISAEKN